MGDAPTGKVAASRATRLREQHDRGQLLVVPNAWDVASARVLEQVGFATVASTSAGVAWAHGYRDGQQMPFGEVVAVVGRIAAAVSVPVSIDLEGGYLEQSGGVAETVRALVDAGAAGVNFDDGTYDDASGVIDPETLVRRLRFAREIAGGEFGVPLFLIARTELYWRRVGDPETRLEHTAKRLNAYLEAGADCAFVPGLLDGSALRALVAAVDGPLNVMLTAAAPSVDQLRAIGVARATVGAGLFLASMGVVEQAAGQLYRGELAAFSATPTPSPSALTAVTCGQL